MKIKKKPAILLIEDERPLSNIIKTKLDSKGFDTVTTRTVKQAIDYLESIGSFDLIWLDHYLLGKEDGMDFVSKIKAQKKWKDIPIFVVSNTATAEKRYSYLKLGIVKYYVKSDHRLDEIVKDIVGLLYANHKK